MNLKHFISGGFFFLRNLLGYYRKKNSHAPMFISWDITRKCNAHCSFCYSWKECTKNELSSFKKLQLIDDIVKIRPWMLTISGGEPLLDDHFAELLSRAAKKRISLNICTNGLLLKKNADLLIRNNVSYTTVSVDSDLAREHDEGRGVDGLFDEICSGIDYFKSIRTPKKHIINVRLLLHAKNIYKLDQMITFWQKRVDGVLLQPIGNSEITEYQTKMSDFLAFKKEDLSSLKAILKKHKMDNIYSREIPLFLSSHSQAQKRCFSGYFFIHIDQFGFIWNCPLQKVKLGDLDNQRICEMLRSQACVQRVREVKGLKCNCVYNCAMINSYLERFVF